MTDATPLLANVTRAIEASISATARQLSGAPPRRKATLLCEPVDKEVLGLSGEKVDAPAGAGWDGAEAKYTVSVKKQPVDDKCGTLQAPLVAAVQCEVRARAYCCSFSVHALFCSHMSRCVNPQ